MPIRGPEFRPLWRALKEHGFPNMLIPLTPRGGNRYVEGGLMCRNCAKVLRAGDGGDGGDGTHLRLRKKWKRSLQGLLNV